ncbi:uncharacterized protein LOC100253518 [Vitis vinifera]|uniref:Uncharacterized protein n=2 Tax=Vitis vinifera TaxID=29760 RepID=A0A438J233_VITVI|nr:uncharacterized protein LOC100253518 [Vitis vinifera]XP_010658206.1 uncharacterized protein LOC100253518 [Vitis vinifera]XP_059597529.1 uncharacterized protein LOC100253518 [Vitis vinifera]RVX03027.1 hypothetical protein CK203_016688 [Vitis vinifera]|eukprot:XP_003633434.1 PREDICTED: uncharacterized protein LOC100253518 [Vitis vinifera]
MGKSLPTTTRLQEFARVVTSEKFQSPKHAKPISRNRVSPPETTKLRGARLGSERVRLKMESSEGQRRMPLAQVVSDCAKRWFQDTLKEAKAGDTTMQVLVGQMYFSGYGVSRDAQKGRAWISRASKSRSSALKVGDKHPGYNASDSDSDDLKNDEK